MDSDAFILPGYTSSSPARSHQVHTSGTKRARSPLGRGLFFFFGPRKPVEKAFCDWLIYFIFFYPGGLLSVHVPRPLGGHNQGLCELETSP